MNRTRILYILLFGLLLAGGCDEETPSGTDTVSPDTQVMDTETVDSTDTNPPDTNETDSGTDSGDTTAETDAPLVCDPTCGDNATCENGTCVCDSGFDDCDSDATNGCEAELSTLEFCGGCTPHPGCTVFGTDPTCSPIDDTFHCVVGANSCAFGYVDANEDLSGFDIDPSAVNGCEVGVLYNTDLEWNLGEASKTGTMRALAVDGDTLYAAYTDASASDAVKVLTFDTTATPFEPIGTEVDLQFPPGTNDRVRIAAHDGFVAITNDRGDVYVYETDTNGDLVKVRQETLLNVADIELVSPGIVTGSRAEFVAVGNGTRWYGIFDKGSEPSGPTCLTGDPGSTTSLCILGTSTEPASGTAITTMTLAGKTFAISVGATTQEFEMTTTPELVVQTVTGDAIPTTATRLITTEEGVVYSAGATIDRFEYTESGGSLTERTSAGSVSIPGALSFANPGAHETLLYGDAVIETYRYLQWSTQSDEPIVDGSSGTVGGFVNDMTVVGSNLFMVRGPHVLILSLDIGPE